MGIELVFLIILIIIFLFSVIVHEVCHGLMADSLGDSTPRLAGRLSLNPFRHLDPIGSFLVPLFLIISRIGFVFGWAKPVPVNPYNFRDQKYGMLKVSIAGISANIGLALIFGLPVMFLPSPNITLSQIFNGGIGLQGLGYFQRLSIVFATICWVNLLLAIFNLFPLPPFDGYHIFATFFPKFERKVSSIAAIQFISIIGAIFFLIFIGIPFIIRPLFMLITGGKIPLS